MIYLYFENSCSIEVPCTYITRKRKLFGERAKFDKLLKIYFFLLWSVAFHKQDHSKEKIIEKETLLASGNEYPTTVTDSVIYRPQY